MVVTISSASLTDAPALVDLSFLAFANDSSITAKFPMGQASPEQVEETVAWRLERLRRQMSSPGSWFKAVDNGTGEIVGFTAWIPPAASDAPGPVADATGSSPALPSIANRELFEDIATRRAEAKKRVMGEGTDFWFVQVLTVSPEYQRRGIAGQLLEAGCKVVDKDGKMAYLEATPVARKVYERCGFEPKEIIELMGGEYALTIMVRPAKDRASCSDSS